MDRGKNADNLGSSKPRSPKVFPTFPWPFHQCGLVGRFLSLIAEWLIIY
jgi:hypothetical protein